MSPETPASYDPVAREKTMPAPQRVTVVDFDMEFSSMVQLMIKAAFASVPAMCFIAIVGFLLFGVLFAITSALS